MRPDSFIHKITEKNEALQGTEAYLDKNTMIFFQMFLRSLEMTMTFGAPQHFQSQMPAADDLMLAPFVQAEDLMTAPQLRAALALMDLLVYSSEEWALAQFHVSVMRKLRAKLAAKEPQPELSTARPDGAVKTLGYRDKFGLEDSSSEDEAVPRGSSDLESQQAASGAPAPESLLAALKRSQNTPDKLSTQLPAPSQHFLKTHLTATINSGILIVWVATRLTAHFAVQSDLQAGITDWVVGGLLALTQVIRQGFRTADVVSALHLAMQGKKQSEYLQEHVHLKAEYLKLGLYGVGSTVASVVLSMWQQKKIDCAFFVPVLAMAAPVLIAAFAAELFFFISAFVYYLCRDRNQTPTNRAAAVPLMGNQSEIKDYGSGFGVSRIRIVPQ